MNFETKKSLGQNFIRDTGFLDAILDKLDILPTDTIVEVGTGQGALTKCLAKRAHNVISYELDKRLEPTLREMFPERLPTSNVQIIFADALKTEIKTAGEYKVIANIPYYITTPLIMKFLDDPKCIEINVLVQKEIADRITARPNTPEYGALSITVQSLGTPRIIKYVPRTMFFPRPNVDSAFVSISKQHKTLPNGFDTFIKNVFSKRRKKISNSVPPEILTQCNIDPNLRPENITPEQFVKLCEISTKNTVK